jgi:hypothetical protein
MSAGGAAHLSENVFRIEVDSMFGQKRLEFRFEGHLLVMVFLVSDVADDRRHVGFAHAEGTVAFLPRKIWRNPFGLHPSGRIGLDDTSAFRKATLLKGLRVEDECDLPCR